MRPKINYLKIYQKVVSLDLRTALKKKTSWNLKLIQFKQSRKKYIEQKLNCRTVI